MWPQTIVLVALVVIPLGTISHDPCNDTAIQPFNNCTIYYLDMEYGQRHYIACLPSSLQTMNYSNGIPLVINYHGWTDTAQNDLKEAALFAANIPAIIVHPQGYADHKHPRFWGSWNAPGTSESPGPAGDTCTTWGGDTNFCYDSCASRERGCDSRGCDWTTCVDDYEFTKILINDILSKFCVDEERIYATGCSNGGMMVYGLGAKMADIFAAIAPLCGSFTKGFLQPPPKNIGIPLMDVHGTQDDTVPINLTSYNSPSDSSFPLSSGGWYYTLLSDIVTEWRSANGCPGRTGHYHTSFDGVYGLWCEGEEGCERGEVVWCSWEGGHDYYGGSGNTVNGGLVWEFLSKFKRKRE